MMKLWWSMGAIAMAVVALRFVVLALEPRLAFFPEPGVRETPADRGVPFESLEIATADGERLRAWWIPSEAPRARVLYFHGNGGNLSMWRDVLLGLHARGCEIFAIDYRGYGESSGRPSEAGLYRDVEAAVRAFEAFPLRSSQPTIYWGRSLGVAMAAHAVSVKPPDGLVLEAGFASARAVLRDTWLLWVLSFWGRYRFSTLDNLRGVVVPALVLHGTADRVVPFERGRDLFDRLPEPKWFVGIEGGDHNDPAPRDPSTYWGAVESFFDRQR